MRYALFVFLLSFASLCNNILMAQNMERKRSIPIPENAQPAPAHFFIGEAWVEYMITDVDTYNCSVANVIFEPGTRNNWHKHAGGQILIVTEGTGYYQEKGKPARLLKKGDTVAIAPDIEHWHGATSDSWFSHIAIGTNPTKGGAEWLEPVDDEQYNNL